MPLEPLSDRTILAESIKTRILTGEQVPIEELKSFLLLARQDSDKARSVRVKKENAAEVGEKPPIDFF